MRLPFLQVSYLRALQPLHSCHMSPSFLIPRLSVVLQLQLRGLNTVRRNPPEVNMQQHGPTDAQKKAFEENEADFRRFGEQISGIRETARARLENSGWDPEIGRAHV